MDEPLVWRQGSVIAQSNTAGTVTQVYAYGPYGDPQVWGGSRFSYAGQIQLAEVGPYHRKARVAGMLDQFMRM